MSSVQELRECAESWEGHIANLESMSEKDLLSYIDDTIAKMSEHFSQFSITETVTGPIHSTGVHEWRLGWGRLSPSGKQGKKPEKAAKAIFISICKKGTCDEVDSVLWFDAPAEMRLILAAGIKSLYVFVMDKLNFGYRTARRFVGDIEKVKKEMEEMEAKKQMGRSMDAYDTTKREREMAQAASDPF